MPDLTHLLTPIAGDNPAGADLRLASGDLTFSQMDELRREADPLTDPGGDTKNADWRGVTELCESSLLEKSKDLEIAAVMTQAQVGLHGLTGLQSGLQLLTALVNQFWENVYPGYDEGEIILAIRARPLSWIGTSKEFLTTVRKVPLSEPIGESPRTWFDYEQAQRVDKAGIKADQTEFQELIDDGYISTETWHTSLSATPPERLGASVALLQGCQTALNELSAACDEKFADDAPYFMDLSNLLDEMETLLSQFANHGAPIVAAGEDTASTDTGQPAAMATTAAVATPVASGPIVSRDDAYRKLREVAEYLRKTEPHSPVPPLIDRAVRWGNMSFENLFDDVVRNQDVRNQTKEMLGLQDPPM